MSAKFMAALCAILPLTTACTAETNEGDEPAPLQDIGKEPAQVTGQQDAPSSEPIPKPAAPKPAAEIPAPMPDGPDILGFVLGATLEQVRSHIEQDGWGLRPSPEYQLVGTDELYTTSDTITRQKDGYYPETLIITYTSPPVKHKVMQIQRTWGAPIETMVTAEKMIDSLKEKYGEHTHQLLKPLATHLFWYDGHESDCAHDSVNAYINQAFQVAKQKGPDAVLPCEGKLIHFQINVQNRNGLSIVGGMTGSMTDMNEMGRNRVRFETYASEIQRKAMEEQVKSADNPEL